MARRSTAHARPGSGGRHPPTGAAGRPCRPRCAALSCASTRTATPTPSCSRSRDPVPLRHGFGVEPRVQARVQASRRDGSRARRGREIVGAMAGSVSSSRSTSLGRRSPPEHQHVVASGRRFCSSSPCPAAGARAAAQRGRRRRSGTAAAAAPPRRTVVNMSSPVSLSGTGSTGGRVDGLDQEVILVHVQPVGGHHALRCDAGPDHLGRRRSVVLPRRPSSSSILPRMASVQGSAPKRPADSRSPSPGP